MTTSVFGRSSRLTVAQQSSELGHVGAVRGEGQAPDLSPASAALLKRLCDLAGVLPGRPDQDAGAGAGNGRAEGTELGSVVDELHRARIELTAALLVDAVAEASGDEIEVGRLQAENEPGGGGDVGDGVGQRQLCRNRLAGMLG